MKLLPPVGQLVLVLVGLWAYIFLRVKLEKLERTALVPFEGLPPV